jgi:hypothetical protein
MGGAIGGTVVFWASCFMHTKRKTIFSKVGRISASLLLGLPIWITLGFCDIGAANANVTYYYSGNPLTSETGMVDPGITAAVTFDSSVTPEYFGEVSNLDIVSFSASGLGMTLTIPPTIPSLLPSDFVLKDGSITNWAWFDGSETGPFIQSALAPAADIVCIAVFCRGNQVATNSNDPGVWSTIPPKPMISVTAETGGKTPNTAIIVTASPTNTGMTLQQVASALGYPDGLDWVQTVSIPTPSPFYQARDPCVAAAIAAGANYRAACPGLTSTIDPPIGGYFERPSLGPGTWPFYFSDTAAPLTCTFSGPGNASNECFADPDSMSLYDNPADGCLPGGSAWKCGVAPATYGALVFDDQLVGILPCSTPGVGECNSDGLEPSAPIPFLYAGVTLTDFDWTDTFNGTSGRIPALSNLDPVDPGSGTGGITILSSSNVPEPASTTLLISGFSLMWLVRKRRTPT